MVIRELNLSLDICVFICFARWDAKRANAFVGPGRGCGIGSNHSAPDPIGRTRALEPISQPASLSEECQFCRRATALRGGARGSMAGTAGMVSSSLPHPGARPVDWLG